MCGIAIEVSKIRVEHRYVWQMLGAISHRGQDDVYVDWFSKFSIGYRRFAITEIPCEPKFKRWKVYLNGEIYNYKELGYNGCEVEVVSQGLEDEGVDFIKKLNGMFFIAATDGEQLYCFRDRYGIKPVYYYENDKVLLVASEIKAILVHPEYKTQLNEDVKKQWFVFNNVLTDETLFKKIYKLEKGTTWNILENKKEKFFNWKFSPQQIDYEEAKEKVRDLVIKAVKRQIPKEVKYASCLSGGVDSNVIASILEGVKTFTVGFEGVEDEREAARLLKTDNEQIVFSGLKHFEDSIYHLEDLRVGACWSNYGMFEEIAKQGYKVCFDGGGADELFGGYVWRYDTDRDYYDVVNRTGERFQYCEDLFKKVFSVDTFENRLLFDCNYFLEGVLLSVDKMSMAHTVEVRLPFLDNDLVDFCLTLPHEYRQNKKILKDAFKDYLPSAVIQGKKRGFSSPDWFEGEGNQAYKWAKAAFERWEKIFNNKR